MSARVLVTRAAEDAPRLSEPLRQAGFTPVEVPLVHRRMLDATLPAGADWLVLTSRAAVDVVLAAVASGWAPPLQVACVGPGTAERARSGGLSVVLVPEIATGSALADELGDLSGQSLLWPRAVRVTPGNLAALRSTGAEIVDVPVYDNVAPEGVARNLTAAWPVDVVTLLSGSAARRLAEGARSAGLVLDMPVVVIGPSTAAAAKRHGLRVAAVAEPHTVPGLVAAVGRVLGTHDGDDTP